MKITSAKFIMGVVDETAILYDGTPQIAFIGRSNVGKSSTLNALIRSRRLVKTGRTPGKTREINFFSVSLETEDKLGGELYFVDLPGYGYAKISKQERKELSHRIQWYVTHPQADISLICILIDAKTGPTELDIEMIELVQSTRRDFLVAVNKIDKLNQKEAHRLVENLKEEFGMDKVITYSATKKKNIHTLFNQIISRIL